MRLGISGALIRFTSFEPYFYYRIYVLLTAFHIELSFVCLLLQHGNAQSVDVPLNFGAQYLRIPLRPPSKFRLSHLRGSSHDL